MKKINITKNKNWIFKIHINWWWIEAIHQVKYFSYLYSCIKTNKWIINLEENDEIYINNFLKTKWI